MIVVFTTFALEGKRSEVELINKKADKIELIELEKEVKKKASVEYVRESIEKHEEKEIEMLKPIQKDLSDIKNYLFYNKLPKED